MVNGQNYLTITLLGSLYRSFGGIYIDHIEKSFTICRPSCFFMSSHHLRKKKASLFGVFIHLHVLFLRDDLWTRYY